MEKYVKPEIEVVEFRVKESIMIEVESDVADWDTLEGEDINNIGTIQ